MFFLCLGLDNCKSPEEPEVPEPTYEYRYNVEVIYTRTTVDYPTHQDWVQMYFYLYDPALMVPPNPRCHDLSVINMGAI